MELEIPRIELVDLVAKQLETLFVFNREAEREILSQAIETALEKCEHCFAHTKNKYYRKNSEVYFNPFHSAQYSIFLYFLSHTIFLSKNNTLADRIYYLNKSLNCLDLFYAVKMPRIFFLDHPIGSVIGRANYGNRFSFTQNCTVGNNKGIYPTIGENVRMMSGSKILGNCLIGNDVIVSANAYVKDSDIPSCSLVFGASPNLVIKSRPESYFRDK